MIGRLHDLGPDQVGGKGSGLQRLIELGFPVPDALVVPVDEHNWPFVLFSSGDRTLAVGSPDLPNKRGAKGTLGLPVDSCQPHSRPARRISSEYHALAGVLESVVHA